jgi:hypothetical protein
MEHTMAARTLLHWNGRDVPPELAALPPGTYAITPVDAGDAVARAALSTEQVRRLVDAIERMERGVPGVPADESRRRLQALIRDVAQRPRP